MLSWLLAAVDAGAADAVPAKVAEPAIDWASKRTDLEGGNFWMPPATSTNTDSVDWLFYGILGLTIFCFVAITVVVVYFAWKYRHRPGHKAEPSASHNDALEITWTIIPSIIVVFIFVFGWRGFVDLFTPPKHGLEVQVLGQMWKWTFYYDAQGQQIGDDVLHVPVNQPVRVVMRSQDVLHSFFVPTFRVKQDVIPNRYTELWFQATKPGIYRMTCAEYCGQQHSTMRTWVQVHEPGGYEQWLGKKVQELMQLRAKDPAKYGEYLYTLKGCKNCHTIDGSPHTGPSFKGVFGREETMSDGSKITVDENYIRESLMTPQAKIVQGFPGSMPTFQGQLTDQEVDAIIAFLKSLK
jgi:cytochrome c oxidase subunit 2